MNCNEEPARPTALAITSHAYNGLHTELRN